MDKYGSHWLEVSLAFIPFSAKRPVRGYWLPFLTESAEYPIMASRREYTVRDGERAIESELDLPPPRVVDVYLG